MKIIKIVITTVVLLMPLISLAQVQGPMYQVNVRGLPMNCTSYYDEPVAIFLNYQLNNVGVATRQFNGAPVIVFNPDVTDQYSDTVTQWWFAHECAHHALAPQWNSESNADCLAVKQLAQFGIIYNQQQLNAFYQELSTLPGSPMGHLPGPIRAQNIEQCAMR